MKLGIKFRETLTPLNFYNRRYYITSAEGKSQAWANKISFIYRLDYVKTLSINNVFQSKNYNNQISYSLSSFMNYKLFGREAKLFLSYYDLNSISSENNKIGSKTFTLDSRINLTSFLKANVILSRTVNLPFDSFSQTSLETTLDVFKTKYSASTGFRLTKQSFGGAGILTFIIRSNVILYHNLKLSLRFNYSPIINIMINQNRIFSQNNILYSYEK